MNTNGITGPIPIRLQNANPLLFTLQQDHMTIQPYWIMILQLLAIQLGQRVWNLIRHRRFLTTTEMVFFRWIIWAEIKLLQYGFYEEVLLQVAIFFQKSKQESWSREQQLAQLHVVLGPYLPQHWKIEELKEIHKIQRNRLRGKFEFDLFDVIAYFIPIFGHSVWYCYIQSSCIKAEKATPWNCYNAFGYRLYNYIFASYFSFLFTFGIKCIFSLEKPEKPENTTQTSYRQNHKKEPSALSKIVDWIGAKLGFSSCLIVFCFTGALVLPYMFTNVIPMAVIYVFMHCIYFSISIIILFFAILFVNMPVINKLIPKPRFVSKQYRKHFVIANIFAFAFSTYPILLSTLYNYSQYYYYGEDYFKTMKNEFDTRDTRTYINVLTNSVNEKLHSAINFF